VRPSVARGKLLKLAASLPPCLIGMEACSGAHHWARLFQAHGQMVHLQVPKFVTPYRLSGRRSPQTPTSVIRTLLLGEKSISSSAGCLSNDHCELRV